MATLRGTVPSLFLLASMTVIIVQANVCQEETTCRGCVTRDPQCGFCGSSMDWQPRNSMRCDRRDSLIANGCDRRDVIISEDAIISEPSSPHCNGSGTYECGVCRCDNGFYGKHCECDAAYSSEASCKMTEDSEICEGRGTCVCGVCQCNTIHPSRPSKLFSGPFCECNDYSCDFFYGMICGGPQHGKCRCGECMCNPGYTGYACDCTTSQETCIAQGSGLVCNGKGTCRCGTCVCDRDNYYRGPTCEACPTCPGRCEILKPCVQCAAYNTGPYTQEECESRCQGVTIADKIEGPGSRLCRFRDDDNCNIYFTYFEGSSQVLAQRTIECPEEGASTSTGSTVKNTVPTLGIQLVLVLTIIIRNCL